jgi:hypothetical protein
MVKKEEGEYFGNIFTAFKNIIKLNTIIFFGVKKPVRRLLELHIYKHVVFCYYIMVK